MKYIFLHLILIVFFLGCKSPDKKTSENELNDSLLEINQPISQIYDEDTSTWDCSNKSYNFLSSFKFYEAGEFSESLAAVMPKNNDKYGYIDTTGKMVIEPQFYFALPFSEGLAAVYKEKNGKMGFIDKNGNLVIDYKYNSYLFKFKNGKLCVSKDGLSFIINKKEEVLIGPFRNIYFRDGFSVVSKNHLYGIIDSLGKTIVPCIYIDAGNGCEIFNVLKGKKTIYNASDGTIFKENDKIGFKDSSGNIIKDCKYKMWLGGAGAREEKYVVLNTLEKDEYHFIDKGKWGFINKYGELITDFEFENAYRFENDMAPVKKNGKWGCINAKGEVVVDFIFESSQRFYNGYTSKINKETKLWGVINTNNQLVIDYKHEGIWGSLYATGFIPVEKNGKYGIMNKKEEIIINYKYDQIRPIERNKFMVEYDDKWGIINQDGSIIIDCKYEYLIEYVDGLADVRKDNKFGFIDTLGNKIVDFDFYWAEAFSENFAPVRKTKNGKWSYIKLK